MNNYFKKKILSYYLIIFLIPVLFSFFKLQVIDYNKYEKLAGNNSLRSIEIKSPRGIIYDRNGIPLVDNLPTYTLKIIPIDIIDQETKTIYKRFNYKLLKDVLDLDKETIISNVNKHNKGLEKFRPFPIKKFIDFSKKIVIEEHMLELPGIVFSEIPARIYVSEVKLSHVLGYLRIVDKERRLKLNHPDSLHKYSLGDVYGYSGIEKKYEHLLRGKNGVEYRLVDNRGVDQGKFNQKDGVDVIIGAPLIISIDVMIQSIAENLLTNKVGSIICMDPLTGEILAFANSPNYDLKPFIGPVPNKVWNDWNTNTNTPLLNRLVSGKYPPGSIFKLLTSILILNKNLENIKLGCKGEYELGERIFRCWNSLGHGRLDLKGAIKNSCNIYFYKAVEEISYDDLVNTALMLNFGNLVGIDLPNEKPGIIPTTKYMNKAHRYKNASGNLVTNWARGGAKANMSIGQGDLLVTPVQVINMINIIANKGYSFTPHLIKNKTLQKKFVDFPESIWSYLNSAMWEVVNTKNGTGKNAYVDNAVVRGKTGTAQNPHGEDHSWFSGYITTKNSKKMSMVVMIENGGRGSGTASNIAKEIFSFYSKNNMN